MYWQLLWWKYFLYFPKGLLCDLWPLRQKHGGQRCAFDPEDKVCSSGLSLKKTKSFSGAAVETLMEEEVSERCTQYRVYRDPNSPQGSIKLHRISSLSLMECLRPSASKVMTLDRNQPQTMTWIQHNNILQYVIL